MNLLKTLFSLMFLFAFASTFAQTEPDKTKRQAQERGRNLPPEDIAKRQTQALKDSIAIDEKQEAKIYAIHLEYAQKGKKVWESEISQLEKSQEMQLMNTNRIYEVRKCLTKEQAKRYQKIQDNMQALMQKRREKRETENKK